MLHKPYQKSYQKSYQKPYQKSYHQWVFDRIQAIRCSPLDRAHFPVPGRQLRPPEVSRDRPRAVMGGSGTENGARIGLNFG